MGLVDYSESESDSESPAKPTPKPAPTATGSSTGKKPFQKVVDRANPGKIRVNLPQAQREEPESTSDGPPAKRARTGAGGGLFSGMNSFLPAPKNAAKAKPAAQSGSSRPTFQLKTSAEAGFSRETPESTGGLPGGDGAPGFTLPAPKAPSIPEGMKPEEEVKLVGKPMMFRPLSVARNKKKPVKKTPTAAAVTPAEGPSNAGPTASSVPKPSTVAAPPPKKISLFSIGSEPEADLEPESSTDGAAYEPLFETGTAASAAFDAAYAEQSTSAAPSNTESLDSIADEMNLSAAARRELFGRGGMPSTMGGAGTATKVINFNTDTEYRHNEEVRAAGEQQIHNPVRGIAPGKHNLRKLVSAVQTQRDALEESFAQGKTNRKDASNRYGW